MKSDLDALMQEADLDALLIAGPAQHNASVAYFTGLVHVSDGYVIKKRGEEPILFHFPMEREEAKRTGLRTKNLSEYDDQAFIKQAHGDHNKARALRFQQMFAEFGVTGRIGLYGKGEIGTHYGTLRATEELLPDLTFVAESLENSTLRKARATKDEQELARIRKMGEITTAVVGDVAGFLTSHQVRNGVLITRAGEPLTIGEVKRRINLWLAMRGAENPEATVFAMGRDGGFPHSVGQEDQALETGVPIVFDIFPCEEGGGYFYDFTRTWCLGYAPDDVQALYDDVLDVYQKVSAAIEPNRPCRDFQVLTCELFREKGHDTIMDNWQIESGYVHSLGHGLGLDIHESPRFRDEDTNTDVLKPGSVFTIEPGLYYPERGMGVRLENSVFMRPDGSIEVIADYPMDLVLEMPGS